MNKKRSRIYKKNMDRECIENYFAQKKSRSVQYLTCHIDSFFTKDYSSLVLSAWTRFIATKTTNGGNVLH